ncbi:hypothetical protein AJ87_37815 [Rhizobium yanglingense]|nr:hypothetical protein AJ87_37815 [Rhizobium yanglingense]
MLIPMRRDGRTEDTWFTFSYTPLRDETGAIGGLLCATMEVSAQVIAKRRERHALEELRSKSDALSIVNAAGAAITAELNIDRLTQIAVDAGVALTGAEFGAFFYNVDDGEGGSYMLYALSGVERKNFEKFPMPRNTKVFAPTFSGEGVVRSDDILLDPRYGHNAPYAGMPNGHLPVRSYLAVPVKSRSGAVIGGLFFGHAQPGRFTGAAEASLVSLAGQAAVAIDNARLLHAADMEIARRSRSKANCVDSTKRWNCALPMRSPSANRPRLPSSNHRKWSRLASSRAVSPMISTICCRSSRAISNSWERTSRTMVAPRSGFQTRLPPWSGAHGWQTFARLRPPSGAGAEGHQYGPSRDRHG